MAYFKEVEKVKYEGRHSDNPYAFKFYNPEEKVGDKTMEEILRYGIAYWHTFVADGGDPFGDGTAIRPWDHLKGMDLAKARVVAAFEFFEKIDAPFFDFHDLYIDPEGDILLASNIYINVIVVMIIDYMKDNIV